MPSRNRRRRRRRAAPGRAVAAAACEDASAAAATPASAGPRHGLRRQRTRGVRGRLAHGGGGRRRSVPAPTRAAAPMVAGRRAGRRGTGDAAGLREVVARRASVPQRGTVRRQRGRDEERGDRCGVRGSHAAAGVGDRLGVDHAHRPPGGRRRGRRRGGGGRCPRRAGAGRGGRDRTGLFRGRANRSVPRSRRGRNSAANSRRSARTSAEASPPRTSSPRETRTASAGPS